MLASNAYARKHKIPNTTAQMLYTECTERYMQNHAGDVNHSIKRSGILHIKFTGSGAAAYDSPLT